MHSDTGHLLETSGMGKQELDRLFSAGYQPVPKTHISAVKKKLSGEKEAYVSLTSGGSLSRLCAQWRKEKRARYIKKLGSQSINNRRENRRKKVKSESGATSANTDSAQLSKPNCARA